MNGPDENDGSVSDGRQASGSDRGSGVGHSGRVHGRSGPRDVGDWYKRTGEDAETESVGRLRWFFVTDHGAVVFVREVMASVLAVALIGLLLFAISGLWPPMVAVESGSMDPNLKQGDLVFVMEEHRLAADVAYGDTGVATYRGASASGYRKFGQSGDVIVFRKDGQRAGTPIIHRAMFWVNESENWYAKADDDHIGSATNCSQLRNCPAPHAGFITKGDNDESNPKYDQLTGLSGPVKPAWVVGTAEVRIPYLGWVRLLVGQAGASHAETTAPTSGGEPDRGVGRYGQGPDPSSCNHGDPTCVRQCQWSPQPRVAC